MPKKVRTAPTSSDVAAQRPVLRNPVSVKRTAAEKKALARRDKYLQQALDAATPEQREYFSRLAEGYQPGKSELELFDVLVGMLPGAAGVNSKRKTAARMRRLPDYAYSQNRGSFREPLGLQKQPLSPEFERILTGVEEDVADAIRYGVRRRSDGTRQQPSERVTPAQEWHAEHGDALPGVIAMTRHARQGLGGARPRRPLRNAAVNRPTRVMVIQTDDPTQHGVARVDVMRPSTVEILVHKGGRPLGRNEIRDALSHELSHAVQSTDIVDDVVKERLTRNRPKPLAPVQRVAEELLKDVMKKEQTTAADINYIRYLDNVMGPRSEGEAYFNRPVRRALERAKRIITNDPSASINSVREGLQIARKLIDKPKGELSMLKGDLIDELINSYGVPHGAERYHFPIFNEALDLLINPPPGVNAEQQMEELLQTVKADDDDEAA